jgi:phosphosulfolactate synthase (CoM biosynthesis protein A)
MKKLVIVGISLAALFFLGSTALNFVSGLGSQVSQVSSQLTDLLPAGDAYALGVDEGTKILENTDYVDQMNISVLPGATELINNLKSGQVTEERISQIANLYFPVAAVKAGILNISAENRAEFVRGMIDGYFPK